MPTIEGSAQHPPETRYAKSGEINIAYQTIGEGALDLVYTGSWTNQIEHAWELPEYARFLQRLASFSRLITLDKRGSGLSDRLSQAPTLDERIDDLRAVLDEVGSERAVLFGSSEGGVLSAVFSATYPERVSALIMFGSMARLARADDYPLGWSAEFAGLVYDYIEHRWGTGETALVAPSLAGDEEFRRWHGQLERLTATPAAAAEMMRWNLEIDIRDVLATISVPTLIMHRADETWVEAGCGRYLAESIPGARYLELEGTDHYPYLENADAVVEEIEEFVTGARHEAAPDRVLATVLFTDIVRSTESAAELGDERWRHRLDSHDRLVREQLKHFRGREVNTLGDGFIASFDGPARAIECAKAVVAAAGSVGLELRAGVHTGECERRGDDLGGIAVHIGARVAAEAGPGEVLVSRTVKDLVAGSTLVFEDRGTHTLKGVPGEWQLFSCATG